MCYLKNLVSEDQLDFNHLWDKSQENTEQTPAQESNVLIPCPIKRDDQVWSKDQELLINLFGIIEKNNSLISNMNKVLHQTAESQKSIDLKSAPIVEETHQDLPSALKEEARTKNPLLLQLFGEKAYKYHFELVVEFPETIYKERNFEIKVKLCDKQGKIVQNCNLINICLAACSNEGEWIHENRIGEAFLKGKTEIEMYHGEGLFQKIYARDISRNFLGKKINLVIYGKPSVLRYSDEGSIQSQIDPDDIEPLLIENVTIKAKRKD